MSAPDDAGLRGAIEALLAEWAGCIDDGRATAAAGLFAENAVQCTPAGRAEGRAAIAAGLHRRQAMAYRTSRHLVSNLRLQRDGDPDRVQGQWVLTLFRSDSTECAPIPCLVADVRDSYVRSGAGGWLIASREIVPVFGAA